MRPIDVKRIEGIRAVHGMLTPPGEWAGTDVGFLLDTLDGLVSLIDQGLDGSQWARETLAGVVNQWRPSNDLSIVHGDLSVMEGE